MPLAKAMIEAAGNSTQPTYIEDIFSTYLYTGNGSTQTITNGIDLAGKGGMVWMKDRSAAANHYLCPDSSTTLYSNTTAAAGGNNATFLSTGFTDTRGSASGNLQVSWTFRKQAKFFDVVTFTHSSSADSVVSHALASTPGCVIVKQTNAADSWWTYHRGLSAGGYLTLNTTNAQNIASQFFKSVTSTSVTIGKDYLVSGQYVMYVFAHNAGGFGLTGTDNVISCGSFTTDGSGNATVNLGYEPQWIMVKKITAGDEANSGHWWMQDNMRGYPVRSGNSPYLQANTSQGEVNPGPVLTYPTSTGFVFNQSYSGFQSVSFIYIAIRRGPMKTPTTGTSVFSPVTRAGTSADATVSAGFPPDSLLVKNRGGSASSVDWSFNFFDKLRSPGYRLSTAFTNAEDTSVNFITSFDQNGVTLPATGYTATNGSGYNYINYFLRRAPGFFDEVCYTGANSTAPQSHNLGVAPELMIVKKRSSTVSNTLWAVYSAALGNTKVIVLNSNAAAYDDTLWNNTSPTATGFTLGANLLEVNYTGAAYVAYLFASCPGVSKCTAFTGTGALQTIDCGFTGGARFVLIKRTDSTGDWYVWDSSRGLSSSNDPYLLLNSTAAEVTSTNWVDTTSTGFQVTAASGNNVNINGASYIALAIS